MCYHDEYKGLENLCTNYDLHVLTRYPRLEALFDLTIGRFPLVKLDVFLLELYGVIDWGVLQIHNQR